ncbi:MAG TPA: hypothetical protein VKF14_12430 [Candidatus Dormibacteraeota bacterium]|nr:hypothetical protein [Candidatus Dormibacteraeota bacterium]
MNVDLAIAGVGCAALAIGHATVGLRSVFPNLTKGSLPNTPFGPASMTLGMVRVTWHIVTVVLLAFSSLLLILAWAADANPKTLLLRWCAAVWLAVTGMMFWNARHRLRSLLRLPAPWVSMVVAVMCWKAST